jgi:uncharacterized protein YndB with AHSA1/START domain
MADQHGIIEREIFIAATPESVFKFLTEPGLLAQWLGLSQNFDARPGGIFRVEISPGNIAAGVFSEVKPYHRVAFTWGWESADSALASLKPGASLVEIELEARNGGTLVRLRHSGLPEELQGIHGERWSYRLGLLRQSVPLANSTRSEDQKE